MYSRSYYDKPEEGFALPESYNGTVFDQGESPTDEGSVATTAPTEGTVECSSNASGGGGSGSTLFGGVGRLLGGLVGGSSGGFSLRQFKLGTEEILILATAAFLFFSKDGDKECALLLLLLLLIN